MANLPYDRQLWQPGPITGLKDASCRHALICWKITFQVVWLPVGTTIGCLWEAIVNVQHRRRPGTKRAIRWEWRQMSPSGTPPTEQTALLPHFLRRRRRLALRL